MTVNTRFFLEQQTDKVGSVTLPENLCVHVFCFRVGDHITAPEIYAYLSRVLYNKRSKMNPWWTSLVVGGVTEGKTFLGQSCE